MVALNASYPIWNRLEPDSAEGFAEGWQSSIRPAGVLSRRYRSIPTTTAAEKDLTRLRTGAPDITVERLTGLLCSVISNLRGWPVFF
jgi:hypothetical protein